MGTLWIAETTAEVLGGVHKHHENVLENQCPRGPGNMILSGTVDIFIFHRFEMRPSPREEEKLLMGSRVGPKWGVNEAKQGLSYGGVCDQPLLIPLLFHIPILRQEIFVSTCLICNQLCSSRRIWYLSQEKEGN